MDKVHHYSAFLDIYIKQEATLAEKSSNLTELLETDEKKTKKIDTIRNELEKENVYCNQKTKKSAEKLLKISHSCKKTTFSWQEFKDKLNTTNNTHAKMLEISQDNIGIVQSVSRDLKQLESELQSENIMAKMEGYRQNTKTDLLDKYREELQGGLNEQSRYKDVKHASDILGIYKSNKELKKDYEDLDAAMKRIQKNLKLVRETMSRNELHKKAQSFNGIE